MFCLDLLPAFLCTGYCACTVFTPDPMKVALYSSRIKPHQTSVITVEPPNNGHTGDEHLVHYSEVVPSSEVEMYGQ